MAEGEGEGDLRARLNLPLGGEEAGDDGGVEGDDGDDPMDSDDSGVMENEEDASFSFVGGEARDPGEEGEGEEEGEDAWDEDEVDEEDVPFAILPERIQQTVKAQLTAELRRLEVELVEKDSTSKSLETERESLGVDLYQMQQELAKMQEQLEGYHDKYTMESRLRQEAEEEVASLVQAVENDQETLSDFTSRYEKYQLDLDRLNETLIQVEKYNEDIQSKIAVKRREAYKAESDVSALEKEKKTQDILIDSLQEQVKKYQERIAMYEAQYEAQKEESENARQTLAAAQAEMESISFDKRQLLQQWKSSLIGMQRRDEALKATQDAIRKQQEEMLALEAEMKGIETSTKEEEEKNQTLTSVLRKLENERVFYETQVADLETQRQKINERHGYLKHSLDETEKELDKLNGINKRLGMELASVEKSIEKTGFQIRTLEDEILTLHSMQTTAKTGKESTGKAIRNVMKQLQDRDMDLAQVQNDISRVRMDILTTKSQIEGLEETLQDLEKELKSRAAMAEKYELEIRRKNDEIERKQRELDKLNRKYEQIVAAKADREEGEDIGPLEATIKSITRQIEEMEKESEEMQRLWTRNQSELVTLINALEDLNEQHSQMKSEFTVLHQKETRLEVQLKSHVADMKELDRDVQKVHLEIGRAGALISKNEGSQATVAEDIFALETELQESLKELEKEDSRLSTQTEETREKKKTLLDEIVEAERQIMMWEKKIQLAKETSEAVDPSVGQEDIRKMEREIHIMEMRYGQLQRDQKKLIEEMERLIYKRELIANKGRAQAALKKGVVTKSSLKREVAAQAQELEKEKQAAFRCDQQIKELYADQRVLSEEVESMAYALEEKRKQRYELEAEMQDTANEKARFIDLKARCLRLIQRFSDIKDQKFRPTTRPESVEEELHMQTERRHQIEALLEELIHRLPESEPQVLKIKAVFN